MASTYTTNIRLTKQGDGDNPNSWGLILNNEVIGSYKDYEKSNTTILKIVPPVNNGFIGYIVARGSPEISKGI